MKLNYEPIGNHIKFVDNKNKDNSLEQKDLMGINMIKEFFPSVANTIGVDLSKYKVVNKNQFAFNSIHVSRDELLPISLLNSDNSIIVSPAYSVFEIENTEKLEPEYLMMWMRRPEFDRRCWFYTDTDIRGKLRAEDFCNIKIPVLPIDEQREIVAQYNTIQNRIELKQKINENLESMAQAIFKSWFVDFDPLHKLAEFEKGESKHKTKAEIAKSLYMTEETLSLFPITFNDNGLPTGWEEKKVQDIITRLKPKTRYKEKSCLKIGQTPVYEQGENIILGYHNNKPDFFANKDDMKFIFGDHTCNMKLSCVPFSISENVISLSGKEHNSCWTYYAIEGKQKHQEYKRHYSDLIVKEVIVPDDKNLTNSFDRKISEFEIIKSKNEKEIQTLNKLKEVLLSKLTDSGYR